MDATAQAELVRSGQASALELVDAAIARIEALNPRINAVIHELFDEGREAASGELADGPFRGVPLLLKDLGPGLAGQPLHLGMRLLKDADFRMPVDSYLGLRLREAGFVTIGKTNTPELGILPTTEPDAYGPSRNPWDLERSTGGSSGGSAAAVAAGMVPLAHANDGGGSIRIPASACGLFGLKPTRQRISEGPLIGDNMSGLTVELAVTRSVRDAATLLEAVHGPAPGDPYVAPAPERPYTDELSAAPGRLRIGVAEQPAVPGLQSDPECVAAVRAAAELLESLGHSVEDSSPLDAQMAEALDLEGTFLTRWAAGQTAALDQFSVLLGREVGPDDVEPLTWALAELGRERSGGRYLRDIGVHQAVARAIAAWHEGGFDLLLTPTMAEPPVPLGTYDDSGDDPLDAFRRAVPAGAFTAIFNVTGQPAASLPLHWTESGLPVGVQLVAPVGREDVLIRVAAQVERERPWADRTPPVLAARDTFAR
ncbi:MAG: amidase [Solirubrobacterales bacterium]|nr:amidase [Solirubrobacterales bacterium]